MLLALAATAEPIPVHVPGRVIEQPDGSLGFGWPGIYFEGRFAGPAVRLRVDAPRAHMRLLVDGDQRLLLTEPGQVDVTIAGLAPGAHVVRLETLTESQSGGSSFQGFFAPAGSSPLPVRPRSRQIEFVGDSNSVGYGNSSPTRQCSREEVHDRTDTQKAFTALTAKRFDADYRIIAYSGFGVVRNYDGGDPDRSLPAIYDRAKPDHDAPARVSNWNPQIIVVALGTNDFSTPLKAGEKWRDQAELRTDFRESYVAFLRRLAGRYPGARFILAVKDDATAADVEQVASEFNAGDPELARTMRFGELQLTGCDWHLSLADHRRVSDLLAATIAAIPDAWNGR